MGLADLNPLTGIVNAVGGIIGDLVTTDKERLEIALKEKELDLSLVQGQLEVNAVEASHRSVFVAGWRPAIGWVGAGAMAYQFLLYPFLIWIWALLQAKGFVPVDLAPPPKTDVDALWVILSGILGLGTLRTAEKVKNVTK